MRRDAALFEPAPPRTGKRGRPRLKGQQLPTPPEPAAQAHEHDWREVEIDMRGHTVTRLVHARDVLWYQVNKRELVRLVVVRDPAGVQNDDYFFTTDLAASGAEVATRYAGRWPIEVCFRDVKQDLGGQDPSPGSDTAPNAQPVCRYGCTHSSGAGTSTPDRPDTPGFPGPGTGTRAHRAPSTPLQPYAAHCGRNELPQCHIPSATTAKSPRHYWTPSPTPHDPNPRVRKSTPRKSPVWVRGVTSSPRTSTATNWRNRRHYRTKFAKRPTGASLSRGRRCGGRIPMKLRQRSATSGVGSPSGGGVRDAGRRAPSHTG